MKVRMPTTNLQGRLPLYATALLATALLVGCPDVPLPTASGPGAIVATATDSMVFEPSETQKTVYVWNGGLPLNGLLWQATSAQDWISISPSSGLSYGPFDGDNVVVTAGGGGRDMRPGASLFGEVVFASVGGVPSSKTVTVEARSDDGIFAGTNVSSAVAGDFDGDGMVDFAALNGTSVGIDVFLRAPAKGMAGDQFIPMGEAGEALTGLALADLNSDGIADLVAVNVDANTLVVTLGSSSGVFGAPIVFSLEVAGETPIAFALGDFDVDGIIDIGLAGSGILGNPVTILETNFAATTLSSAGIGFTLGPSSLVAAGDLLGDSRPDIAVALANTSGVVSVFENRALAATEEKGESFLGTSTNVLLNGTIKALALIDLTNDGRRDIVTVLTRPTRSLIAVGVNLGGGEFSNASTETSMSPISMAFGDFDGDMIMDIAVGSSDSTVWIHKGAGTGGFFPGVSVAAGLEPKALRSTDWNGDGTVDLVASDTAGMMTVLLGDGLGGFTP